KKMKKIIAITTSIFMFVCFSTVSAYAGAARRHTIEGFMLGTGVAILGAAIINGINKDNRPQYTDNRSRNGGHRYTTNRYAYKDRHHNGYQHRPSGHWEIERVWVEPIYEKKWNPGHYNRRGEWVNGRNEKFLVRDGYWQEEKVWVRY
ncbi:MAG: hypothetical protein KKE44_20230, partial [Proteobacteria bacterium]|nr:hypothetical protein [Pseudomonadota bacterium]MBU1585060.1 hypothetical protein [Pseudomonadota bacterium]